MLSCPYECEAAVLSVELTPQVFVALNPSGLQSAVVYDSLLMLLLLIYHCVTSYKS